MKNQVRRTQKGAVSLVVLMAGMLLIFITLSFLTRQVNEVTAVQSFQNRIQAHYLVESGMDILLWQLYEWSEEAVDCFVEKTVSDHSGKTPSHLLSDTINACVVQPLESINHHRFIPLTNPFEDLPQPHSLRMKADASSDERFITVTVMGTYGKARVTQRAVVQMPHIAEIKKDPDAGHTLLINDMILISRSQVLSDW